MQLVSYEVAGERVGRVGVIEGDQVFALEPPSGGGDQSSMRHLIEQSAETSDVRRIGTRHALTDVRLRTPLSDPPGNVICLGRNYEDHAQESARARGEQVARPTFFSKAITSIVGPDAEIPYDAELSRELDWEAELAVVIGRHTRNVAREDALSCVFGYTVLNDISARDLQYGYGGQFFFGKSLDGACPVGPWIVTADEVPDPQNLRITLRVDGVTKQDDSTSNMIFDVADCIAILSRGMTLLPGQIIATGTPAGVGFARTPPEYLRPGNLVEAEVEGIGVLRNTVAAT